MSAVTVKYHHEDCEWWAESDDVAGFSAVGSSIDEVRTLAKEGLAFYLEREVEIVEELANGARLDLDVRTVSPRGRWFTETMRQVAGFNAPSFKVAFAPDEHVVPAGR